MLCQDGESPPSGDYAAWMPFQISEAAKTEALEKQLAGSDLTH